MDKVPKVFISYSWSSHGHQALVKEWAERLIADGIDTILDIFDLKEGDDKYAFMERMVTDPAVTHVLVICDSTYSQKADARKSGVGTESQILSKEVYDKVQQSKVIPIASERDEHGEPHLPTFLKSRIWIDFSTPEGVNENWEQLIRLLYGKPAHQKPKLGKAPSYIREGSAGPASPAVAKFATLKQAILNGKPALNLYRKDFFESCFTFAREIGAEPSPSEVSHGDDIVAKCGKLKQVRDHFVDWILLECEAGPLPGFEKSLFEILEQLRALKPKPLKEANALFVYEVFLYAVAALIKSGAFALLREVFTTHYLIPEDEHRGNSKFERFDGFYGYSELLKTHLHAEKARGGYYYSGAAELLKRQADRADIPFRSIIEAELLVVMVCFITPHTRWYPQTLYYAGYSSGFPLFVRAAQKKYFKNIATVTGIQDAKALVAAIAVGLDRLKAHNWGDGGGFSRSFAEHWNLEALDTLQ
ncbi:MAG: hypothetical protein RL088_2938 [Verrucomicrobiota bacterium]|jgi:hypothetical protein